MGASVLALSIPQHLVLTEGISEAILLPTLFREALNVKRLQFRIAPGIAETPHEALVKLTEQAGRVVFLVDDDKAGRLLKKRLVKAGIPSNLVITLGFVRDGAILEDIIEPTILVDAVNAELNVWRSCDARLGYQDRNYSPRPVATGRWPLLQGRIAG